MGKKFFDESDKLALVSAHEDGVPAATLALQYGISVPSVAAYVAHAHRNQTHVFDCPTKAQKRALIHSQMLSEIGISVKDVNVLFLAGDRPHETKLLTELGVSPNHLWPVESNVNNAWAFQESLRKAFAPAEVLRLQKQLLVTKLSEARPSNHIDCSFLDFCTPIGSLNYDAAFPEIEAFVCSDVLNNRSIVTVAVCRGHDKGVCSDDQRYRRIRAAFQRFPGSVKEVSRIQGQYKNSASKGHLTYLYSGFKLERQ